jgi:hypothetical protein
LAEYQQQQQQQQQQQMAAFSFIYNDTQYLS